MLAQFKSFSWVRRFWGKTLALSKRLRNAARALENESNERVMSQKQADVAVFPTWRDQAHSPKFAVYLVSEAGVKAHLVCLEGQSLRSAAEFESWLHMNIGPRTDVTLLGRFDSVHFIGSEAQVESLVLGKKYFEPAAQDTLVAVFHSQLLKAERRHFL